MNKHEYLCQITEVVRKKSSCSKRQVGAVFVNDDYEILATGFNEAPRGFPHCDRQLMLNKIHGNDLYSPHTCGSPCTRTIHAEQNAICQAAKRGTSLKGSILYCTYLPCVNCARLIVNLQVKVVFYREPNEDGGCQTLKQGSILAFKWDCKTIKK